MSPSTVFEFVPMFKTVSSMPGIETAPPERTETKSGRRGEPKPRPVADSRAAMPKDKVSTRSFSLVFRSRESERLHQAVDSTKAAGTGKPAAVIRIKFHALLPTSCAPSGGSGECGRIL